MNSIELIKELVALPGPPGQEQAVCDWLAERVRALGGTPEIDPKGNLLVHVGRDGTGPSVLVTAHMDEIALMVTDVEPDGRVRVAASGGSYPWKWGEGPMEILTPGGAISAILSFGSIHTNHPASVVEHARHNPLTWDKAYLFTGMDAEQLAIARVRPGLRAVLAPSRRVVTEFNNYIGSYFLDDRADLAVWMLALEALLRKDASPSSQMRGTLTFAATASEEVGGEGACWILRNRLYDYTVALEIGPKTPEADFAVDDQPTLWVRDGYAAMDSRDADLLAECCTTLGLSPHWQYLSRGGSDASCAAAAGLTARPITIAFPVENSHGYEIMHRDAPDNLTRLLLALLDRLNVQD